MKYIIKKQSLAEGAYDWVAKGTHPAPGGGQTKVYERKGADGSVSHNAQTKLPDGREVSSGTMEHYNGHSVHHMVDNEDKGNTHRQAQPHTRASLLKAHYEMLKQHDTTHDKPGYVAAGRVGEALDAYNEAKRLAEAAGECSGCGEHFSGTGGFMAHKCDPAKAAPIAAKKAAATAAKSAADKAALAKWAKQETTVEPTGAVVAEAGLQQLKRAGKAGGPQFNWRVGQMNRRDPDSTPLKDKDRAKSKARVAFHTAMRGVKSPAGTPTLEATGVFCALISEAVPAWWKKQEGRRRRGEPRDDYYRKQAQAARRGVSGASDKPVNVDLVPRGKSGGPGDHPGFEYR